MTLVIVVLAAPLVVIAVCSWMLLRAGMPEGGPESLNKPPEHLRVNLRWVIDRHLEADGLDPNGPDRPKESQQAWRDPYAIDDDE